MTATSDGMVGLSTIMTARARLSVMQQRCTVVRRAGDQVHRYWDTDVDLEGRMLGPVRGGAEA